MSLSDWYDLVDPKEDTFENTVYEDNAPEIIYIEAFVTFVCDDKDHSVIFVFPMFVQAIMVIIQKRWIYNKKAWIIKSKNENVFIYYFSIRFIWYFEFLSKI